jgi:hypothetical protein
MLLGVDYSAGVPSVASLKAAGVRFVARYLSPGARRKNLTRAEADQVRAGGIDVVTVYEDTVGDARGGRPAGRANATFAAQALDRLGAPPGAPCYFAVDYDAQGAALALAVDYVRGAADVLGVGRTGVYGGIRVVRACLDAGACRYAWQAAAWSGGAWEPRAHVQQHLGQVTIGGVTCDRDFATQADYGQWNSEEADVPLTDDDLARITAVVDARLDQTEQALKAKVDQVTGLLFRGDPGTPDGGTHADNLKSIRAAVLDAGITLSPADLEQLAALVAAKLEIAGHPGYEGEAVISMRPRPAAP